MRRIALLSLAALGGCLHPHNISVPPIPQLAFDIDIRDTLYMTRSAAYTVLAYRRADLPNKAVLDSAVERYTDLRGERPEPVTMFVGIERPAGLRQPLALDTVELSVYGAPAGLMSPDVVTTNLFNAWDRAMLDNARGPERR